MVLQLRLTLTGTEPAIWRRLLVDDRATLHGLHRMTQVLMGWWDYHLYQFVVGDTRYVGPDDEPFWDEEIGEDAARVTLRGLGLRKGDAFQYEYDFGDSWQMEIVVERRRQTRGRQWILPWLLEGERTGPPEDCGGTEGLKRILAVLANEGSRDRDGGVEDLDESCQLDQDEARERRELLEWLGDYDPACFDRRAVNHLLVLAGAWGAYEA